MRHAIANAQARIELVVDAELVRAAALDVVGKPVDVDAEIARLRRKRQRGRSRECCAG
jgi:hypothetical protein